MVKAIMKFLGYVPAANLKLERERVDDLVNSVSSMVDENLAVCKELKEKEQKIKAQTQQLAYFHKDRENISKVRHEHAVLEHKIQRLKIERTGLRELIFKIDYNPNDNLTAEAYQLGYEHGKDDGLLEGYIK